MQCSCSWSYLPWYLPFLPRLTLLCHPCPGCWHGFPSAPERARDSGPLLHPFLLTLSWISLPWVSFKCLTVTHSIHPAAAFGYVIVKTSKGLSHWRCLYTFHCNLKEYLLPQVSQKQLLWLSWFVVNLQSCNHLGMCWHPDHRDSSLAGEQFFAWAMLWLRISHAWTHNAYCSVSILLGATYHVTYFPEK